jgi:hypothetical protein
MVPPTSQRPPLDLEAIEQDAFNLDPPQGIIIRMPRALPDFAERAVAQARQDILADQGRNRKGPPIAQPTRLDRSSYQDPTKERHRLSEPPPILPETTSQSQINRKDLPPRAPRPHQNP